MGRLGPELAQDARVRARAVGDHDPRDRAPRLEIAQEPTHVIPVVGPDRGEGHRQVAQGVGGQRRGEATEVRLADAERSAEVLQDLAAMRRQVELGDSIAEHVMDEPRGQVEEELALERQEGAFDAHAVLEDAIEDEVADLVVVGGPGEDILMGVARSGGALASGRVLAVSDLRVGDGSDSPGDGPLPSPWLAAKGHATTRCGRGARPRSGGSARGRSPGRNLAPGP
jgi:hypothetical protein